jgi:class 3 adenylate cyclase
MTAAAPSGVVTFLFTDIEGSTRRWENDAQAMRAALVVHDKVLRTAIEGYDGFLFSHTGDGFVAAFASPTSAVNAAIDAQRELQLPVRMGLATGEAELREGDYFGAVLNRAARVMAAGHGGQILLAESTAGLLSGVDLLDLGPRRLRDVPNPITVFQVNAPGLPEDFPPLRTLGPSPGNLRPATTSFIGRESELDEVQAAVKAHRLVTLTGVGGVGKTRLALEVAGRLADEFLDGVWVFELAAVTDPVAIPDAVAAVLGITQQAGKTVSESVAAALEGRVRLLVFDNCEHVLDAAADLIEAILTQSATVRVVATSREGLGVPKPAHDIHLPQLHRGAALPAFPLARAPIPQTGIDHPGPHQGPIRRRLRGHRPHPAFGQLEHQPPRPPIRPRPAQLQQRGLHRRRHLMRTRHRPMRPIHQPLKASGLIAGQPGVQRLPRHPHLLGDLRNRQPIADHRQHGLIPLLSHAQLPHPGSVKDQPKQLSSISRNTVRHHPKPKCQTSAEVIQLICGASSRD